MESQANFGTQASVCVERNRAINGGGYTRSGHFDIEVYRDGKLLKTLTAKNTLMLAALDDMNNVYLRNGTPKTAWYCGLVDNSGFTTLATSDTAASHVGWTENQSYAESVRQTWTPGASSSQTVVNGTAMTFTINATVSIRGCFIISDSVKGGTAGLIQSSAAFNEGVQVLHAADVLKIVYTSSGAPA